MSTNINRARQAPKDQHKHCCLIIFFPAHCMSNVTLLTRTGMAPHSRLKIFNAITMLKIEKEKIKINNK